MSKGQDRERVFFPNLLNKMKLFGSGVEIGVFDGWHSRLILDNWKQGKLYAVDPWCTYPAYRDDVCLDPVGMSHYRQVRLDMAYEKAKEMLPEAIILKMTSSSACKAFENDSLDWAFIDGRHYREGVEEDLRLWFPKVKVGGVIAGHDYHDMPKHFFEVKQTVLDFFKPLNLEVVEVPTGSIPSWYVIKHG